MLLFPLTFMSLPKDRQSWRAEYILNHSICSWCRLSPPNGEPLKRCRGCDTSIYCSRQCQVAAWPKHKLICRSSKACAPVAENSGFAGYATAVSLGEAVNEWVRIHNYAFSVIAHTCCRSVGGVESNARLGRVVIFNVVSRPSSSDDPTPGDPATAFSIHAVRLDGPEYAPILTSPEDRSRLNQAGDSSAMETGFRGDPSTGNTTPVGFVPIVFAVNETKVALATHCAVYRPSHHPDDAPVDEEMEAVFDDLRGVLVSCILSGVVLRAPADPLGVDPEGGKMVRLEGRRKWSWRREPSIWLTVEIAMIVSRFERTTTLSASNLWTRYRQW